MRNHCLNAACDCTCDDNFCCSTCRQDADFEISDCSCEHSQCALDKVPILDDEREYQSIVS